MVVRGVGPAQIWDGLRSVGWGLAAIVGITGLRFALRAAALSLLRRTAATGSRSSAPSRRCSCGDALGNLTPLGLIVSEPTKAAFLRPHAPIGTGRRPRSRSRTCSTRSSVAAMIAATTRGTAARRSTCPTRCAMPRCSRWRRSSPALGIRRLALWRRPAIVSRVLSRLLPADSSSRRPGDKLRDLEQQIYTFTSRRRDVLAPVLACRGAFHALGVLEVYVTLWLILPAPAHR